MLPDLAARKVLVQAYLYYVLDAPTMSDGEYDKLSVVAADGWGQLEPVRQWQLGDPESAKAGGSHFKYTAATIGAARSEYHRQFRRHARAVPEHEAHTGNWKTHEDGLRYVTAV